MTDANAPQVISADRLDGDVVIEFNNGKSGIFSSGLLYAMLSEARQVSTEIEDEGFESHKETQGDQNLAL